MYYTFTQTSVAVDADAGKNTITLAFDLTLPDEAHVSKPTLGQEGVDKGRLDQANKIIGAIKKKFESPGILSTLFGKQTPRKAAIGEPVTNTDQGTLCVTITSEQGQFTDVENTLLALFKNKGGRVQGALAAEHTQDAWTSRATQGTNVRIIGG